MTYSTAIAWMFKQLPMYQRQGKTAFKANLDHIKLLVTHLNHPEKEFKTIHVAGTNGKGSTCHMLASIFQEAGYKTGLHTSPHLKDFRERIKINGEMIPQEKVTAFLNQNKSFLEKEEFSFFEMSVGMAFNYFAEEKVDIAIIETGLGGRLDSTNIITPEISVITNISFDHMAILGDTLPKIAAEKAGIIKPNTPVVIGQKHKETAPVFTKKAKSVGAEIHFAEDGNFPDYTADLKGAYQKENKQTVLSAIEVLKNKGWIIPESAVKNGLEKVIKNTGLQGRWQILGNTPKIICDTAHNKEGLSIVLSQIKKEDYKRLHIVLGVVNDKDLSGILPLFPQDAQYYFCKANVPRGLEASVLQGEALKFGLKGEVYDSVQNALTASKTEANDYDLIYVGGSTFTVAEII